MLSVPARKRLKAGARRSFDNHDCLGTASQVTQQGRHQHANASGGKEGFELATDGIQFYVFVNFDQAYLKFLSRASSEGCVAVLGTARRR